MPFPGPSSSGDQVLGKRTVPGRQGILITSLVPAARFPRGPVSAMCLLWGATLLADVNHPGSQEDVVSSWESAHSLVENVYLWGRDCPLPSGSGCCPPASLPLGSGEVLVHSWLALLWYSLSPLFCEQARLGLRLELFTGKFSLFFLLSGYPTVWVAISC